MTASVLKQDPNTNISPKMCIILCVRVKINKCSFEPFLCLDLAIPGLDRQQQNRL